MKLFNSFLFFFLDKKETKNQESLIALRGLNGIAGFQSSRTAPETYEK
jgi:hypothetical protein